MSQPELYTYGRGDQLTGSLGERVFDAVCLLDHKYYLTDFPEFYFIVRNDKWIKHPEFQRVCLYREGVVNVHLKPDGLPFTNWISNDLRDGRRIERIYREVNDKVAEIVAAEAKINKSFF